MTMTRKNRLTRKLLISSASVALLTAATSGNVSAQTSADEYDEFEEVVVTGSRLKRTGATAPMPITVVNAEELKASGVLSVGDFLTQLPSLGSTYTMGNSDRFIGTVGGSFLDLRRLGTARTLVLVNGRRHVSSSPGSSTVDINTIPSALIERVEVITGGASAVYGADAVTGVVNFIIKDDYEGVEMDAQFGITGEGGHKQYSGNLTVGGNFGDDRGNAVLSVEYVKQTEFKQNERQYFRDKWRLVENPANGGPDDGIPDRIYVKNAGNFFYGYGGRFTVDGTPYLFDPDGSFREQNLGTVYRRNCSDCDFISGADWNTIEPEYKRIAIAGKVRYELTDYAELFVDTKFINTTGIGRGSGSFDVAGWGTATIRRENPFMSDALGSLMDDNGIDSIRLSRINNDLGLRTEDNERNTYRIVAGLHGDINENWSYEASFNYGRTARTLIAKNNRVDSRYMAAIDVVNVDGENVCRSTITDPDDPLYDKRYANNPLLNGCVPLDIMGAGRGSAEARDWVMADVVRRDVIDQKVFNAVVTGDLYKLPAGDIQLALGVEYRKETSRQKPAELDQMGLTFGNALATIEGEYDVKEIFGEVTLPIMSDQPFMEELTIDAAARYADYSTSGSNLSWKVGSNWRVNDQIRFRGTYGKAVRAPNISELFAPLGQNFYSSYDPCYAQEIESLADQAAKSNRIANCIAAGVPNAETREQRDTSSIPGQSGGNPNLNPEKSKSFTLGAVFTPSFIPDFSLTVDYWNISITDSIAGIPSKDIKDRCVDGANINNIYCQLITRGGADVNYRITNLVVTDQNIAKQEASGFDFEANYRTEGLFTGNDNVSFSLKGTYLLKRNDFPYQDEPGSKDEEAGELGDPHWLMNLKITYEIDKWTISPSVRFIDSMYTREIADKVKSPEYRENPYTGAVIYTDIQAKYNWTEKTSVRLGVNNVFDKIPPSHFTGLSGDSGLYDSRGRFFYAGVNTKF